MKHLANWFCGDFFASTGWPLNSTKQISVLPNAGLPHNEGGHAVYKLTPDELAEYHKHFVVDYGVRIVGGCC